MGINLLVGYGTILLCLVMQCFGAAYLLRLLYKIGHKLHFGSPAIRGAMMLISVMLVLLTGNLLQIAVWAKLFLIRGEFEDFTTAFYHSAVNFTSLGYGDIVMSEKSRLLGSLEAASGVMMFGLSTGVLFWVIQVTTKQIAEHYQHEDHGQIRKSKHAD